MNKTLPAGKILHFLTSKGMGVYQEKPPFLIPRKAPASQTLFLQPLDYTAEH